MHKRVGEIEELTLISSANALSTIAREQAANLTATVFFEKYQKNGIPVIITGLLNNEPDWNLDYLCQTLSTTEFPVRYYGRQRYQQDKRQWATMGSAVEARSMPFVRYAELLRSGEAYDQDIYLGRWSLMNTPLASVPALGNVEARLGLRFPITPLNLWVGPGGHTTCLHYDTMDGTLMQLHGAKRIILFPPSQLYNLYPFSVWNHLRYGLKRRAVYSQLYPEHPDFEAFPRFREALKYCLEVILNQGEVLFIPAGWWHEVTTVDKEMVCSVSRAWNVYPLSRALRLWSKWRSHLGTALAAPHIIWNLLEMISSRERGQKLSQLLQKTVISVRSHTSKSKFTFNSKVIQLSRMCRLECSD